MALVREHARELANELELRGYELVGEGTETHMVMLDLSGHAGTGRDAERALERHGILANRNVVPNERRRPMDASGLRFGTNTLAARGFDREAVTKLAGLIDEILKRSNEQRDVHPPLAQSVASLCRAFPLSGEFD